jgi:transcriptional regulator with PAS, ATPase and Fis domain
MTLFERVTAYERKLISGALKATDGSIPRAAKRLRISRQALDYAIDNRHPELRQRPKVARNSK